MNRSRFFAFAVVFLACISFGKAHAQLNCRLKHIHYIDGGTLIAISAQFVYSGGDSSFESATVALGRGEPGYLFSRDDVSCVKTINGGAALRYNGENIYGSFDLPDAGAGYCWVTPEVEWELSAAVLMEDAKKNKKAAIESRLRAYTKNPRTGAREELKVRIITSEEFKRLGDADRKSKD